MAEFLALIFWLTAFFLFVIEWDEEREGTSLSNLSRSYLEPTLREIREETRDCRHGVSNLWQKLHGRKPKADEKAVSEAGDE